MVSEFERNSKTSGGNQIMKKFSLILAVGGLAAFLFNPLIAGKKNHGPMVIPISGYEDSETPPLGPPTPVIDDMGNLIGFRDLKIGITVHIKIPLLGIKDWAIPNIGVLDLDFYDHNPYILKFAAHAEGFIGEEVILKGSTFGLHRKTSETMTEKYFVSTDVFVSGPLEGVVMTRVSHLVEPYVEPPDFVTTFTGFLYVPAHVDLEVVKKCAQKGKKKAKAKRWFRR